MGAGKETVLPIRVTPGAKRNAVIELKEGVWHIKIAAPPVEGRANEELLSYLSKTLGVRKSNLSVLRGKTGRDKLVGVEGLSQAQVEAKLEAEMGG